VVRFMPWPVSQRHELDRKPIAPQYLSERCGEEKKPYYCHESNCDSSIVQHLTKSPSQLTCHEVLWSSVRRLSKQRVVYWSPCWWSFPWAMISVCVWIIAIVDVVR
jgi:hypothetical protein